MLIKSVTVNHFRNLSPQKIEFQKGINLLFGKNAQGKTNTLEAIYLTTIGRSARTRKDVEMIAHGHNDLLVKLEFSHADISHTLEFRLTRGQKQFFLDGNKFSRISDVIGNFGSVYFAPDSLNLVQGSPAGRRKFMDIINCQLSKNYLRNLQTFQKILEQRNALLKRVSAFEEFEVWDEQLAKFGTKIFIARKKFCEKLSALVKDINKDLSGGEVLQVFYQSPLKLKKTSCENDDNMIDAETFKESGAKTNVFAEKLSNSAVTTVNGNDENTQNCDVNANSNFEKLQNSGVMNAQSNTENVQIGLTAKSGAEIVQRDITAQNGARNLQRDNKSVQNADLKEKVIVENVQSDDESLQSADVNLNGGAENVQRDVTVQNDAGSLPNADIISGAKKLQIGLTAKSGAENVQRNNEIVQGGTENANSNDEKLQSADMISNAEIVQGGAENMQKKAHLENVKMENVNTENACLTEEDIKKLQEQYLLELESSFEKDKILGYTTFGVQSDDFSLKLGGQDARKCASQGQQRTASLSLKLAELEILKEEYGDYPVLLLDDVFSELDEFRRTKLLERIKDIQCLISSTDVITGVECSLFEVSGGKVTFMGENSL